jgi:hypothetical protein
MLHPRFELKRAATPSGAADALTRIKEALAEPGRIQCPRCGWHPGPISRWLCADQDHPEYFYDGCGYSWNTFDTFGECPGCAHQWAWTVCLACGEWSRHEEWYPEGRAIP